MADGASDEKAVTNAQIVIAEWIETAKSLDQRFAKGESVPKPTVRATHHKVTSQDHHKVTASR